MWSSGGSFNTKPGSVGTAASVSTAFLASSRSPSPPRFSSASTRTAVAGAAHIIQPVSKHVSRFVRDNTMAASRSPESNEALAISISMTGRKLWPNPVSIAVLRNAANIWSPACRSESSR